MPKLFIANWKSNKTTREVIQWLKEFEKAITIKVALEQFHHQLVICPSFTSLECVSSFLAQSKVLKKIARLGSQDISPFSAGSYTGAVNPDQLKDLGVEYSLVGHSERRKYFHESCDDIAMKVEQALSVGITPIVCVDGAQMVAQARKIEYKNYSKMYLAYEPVEYIGTGKAQVISEVLETHKNAMNVFESAPFLYGGSVNSSTISSFLNHPEIEGFLVGSASVEVNQFLGLLEQLA